jgi:hypothetical protein
LVIAALVSGRQKAADSRQMAAGTRRTAEG